MFLNNFASQSLLWLTKHCATTIFISVIVDYILQQQPICIFFSVTVSMFSCSLLTLQSSLWSNSNSQAVFSASPFLKTSRQQCNLFFHLCIVSSPVKYLFKCSTYGMLLHPPPTPLRESLSSSTQQGSYFETFRLPISTTLLKVFTIVQRRILHK